MFGHPNWKAVMQLHPLQERREAEGLTRSELVELTGLALTTIHNIEEGTSPYRTHVDVALILADALYCEVSDLFKPDELSHLGRRPLTGGTYIRQSTVSRVSNSDGVLVITTTSTTTIEPLPPVCDKCHYQLPMTGICDNC